MNIKDSYIHNGTAVLKDVKVENSVLKKILAGKDANDVYLGWETVCDLTGIKPKAAGTADKVGHKLTFSGGVTGTWDGSADKTVTIPTKSSWNYDDVYLKLTGNGTTNPLTGTIYVKDVNGIILNSKNKDLNIWEVYGNSGVWASQYGFNLQYLGTGDGNNNDLILWAHNQTGTHVESYRVKQDGTFIFKAAPKVGTNVMYHAGNDGSGSGLDADLLDGYHATCGNNKPWGTIPVITTSGYMDVGKYFEFHYDNDTGSDYSTVLRCTGNHRNIVDLPSAAGTLALTSQIPTKDSWNYDDRYLKLAGGTMSNTNVVTNLNADLLDGYHVGVTNGTVSIFTPWPNATTMKNEGLMPSEYGTEGYGYPDEIYLQSICKWAIAHYISLGGITLIGAIAPNSSGTCILHLYSSSGKDSSTLLPRYCSGTYTTLSGYIYNFGTVNYNWYYRQVSAGYASSAGSATTSTYASNVGSSGTAGTNYVTAANVISMYNWYNSITATDEASNTAIDKWNEIVSFLTGITDTSTLSGILAGYAAAGHNHDGRYIKWGGSAADTNAMTWGTLTAANGYTILSHAASSDGGDWGMVNKGGKIYMQLDGYYYQNEGKYRVTDVSETVTALGTNGNYLTWTKNGSTSNITVPYANNAGSATNANYFLGCTNTIIVEGDANTYYPVMVSTPVNKKFSNIITVWKDLGSKTASYPENHSNGSSSMLYRYDIRNCCWDGNGGYCTTLGARYIYARLVSETMMLDKAVGNFCIWLRGGGTEYRISTSWNISSSDITIYYSSTNVGDNKYPVIIAPRTDIGNEGVYNTMTIPCDVKYASYAGSVAWDNVTGKPATATRWPSWSEVTNKPSTFPASEHNHDGRYLKLSGGTLTGVLHLLGSQYTDSANTGALDLANSDIYGVNSIKFADLAESAGEGLQWYRDATHVDSIWVKNGVIYFSPNRTWGGSDTNYTVWHSGNDGTGSGLNADLLDGVHANGLFTNFSNKTVSGNKVLAATIGGKELTVAVEYAGSAGSANILNLSASIGTDSDTHATALQNYFNANKSSIQRDKLNTYYSSAYGNGSFYMGYFLSGYNSNPYGGFFVAHYDTPYYVGISYGTYKEQTILTSSNYTTYTVKKDGTGASGTWEININGNAATATNADKLDGYHKNDILRKTYDPASVTSLNDVVVTEGIDFTSWDFAHSANINNQPWGDGASSAASVVSFGTDYPFQIYSDYNDTTYLYYRSCYINTGWKAWRQFAFIDSNVASASKWANARTITLTGSVTGSVSIDGSANVTLATTTNHTHTFASLTDKPTTISGYGITDALKIDGSNGTAAGVSALINKLDIGASTPTDTDYYVCQWAGGGTTTTSYHRRPMSAMWNWIKAKTDNLYPTKAGSGASGTWGISISGNAATATKATQDGNGNVIANTYLHLTGGTLTGTLGKSNNYIFKPNGGDFRTTNDTYTGAICISLPANIGNTMLSMWIDIYNYSTNKSFSVHVGGYTYSTGNFSNSPFAMVYGASHKVRLTYDNGFKIYIGETNSTWSYPQISIRDVVLGFRSNYSNWYNDWSVSFVTSFPTIDKEITRYAITTDNISSQSVNYANSAGLVAWSNITGKPATATRWPSWSEVTDKPTFTTWSETSSAASYSLSNAAWTNTITLPTTAGSYILNIVSGNSTLTGVFSIGASDNAKDEISLHLHGNGPRLYARTNGTTLQLSSNDASATSRSVTIKYRRMI